MNLKDKRILDYFQYLRPTGGDLYAKLIKRVESEPETASAIDDWFSSDGAPANDPFFEVRLRGDRPSDSTAAAFLYRPDGILLRGMPLARIVEYVCDWLAIYNEKTQDRNQNVTSYASPKYNRLLFPFVVSALLAGYSMNSTVGVAIAYHFGLFSLSFRNRLGTSMSLPEFADAIVQEKAFHLLSSLNIGIKQDDFLKAFSDEQVSFAYEQGGDFVSIQYRKKYSSKEEAFPDRVLFFVELVGQASRKEISEYFKKSDRTINYVLQALLKQGRIRRIGDAHSPSATYAIK